MYSLKQRQQKGILNLHTIRYSIMITKVYKTPQFVIYKHVYENRGYDKPKPLTYRDDQHKFESLKIYLKSFQSGM